MHTHPIKIIPHVDDDTVFRGVSIRTISRLMREIVREGNGDWKCAKSQRRKNNTLKFSVNALVAGIDLTLVSDFDRLSIIRKGWSIHMIVESKTFNKNPGLTSIALPSPGGVMFDAVVYETELKHFENFKNDMTKLILFSDNWPK